MRTLAARSTRSRSALRHSRAALVAPAPRAWPPAREPATGARKRRDRQAVDVPRTPDGKPDLQGNWSNATQTPLERMGKDRR